MEGLVTVAVLVGAALAVTGLAVWAGHHVLRGSRSATSGAADALGNFIDVFDPARARADRDLASREHMGDVLPSPDDDEPRSEIDLARGRARIRRPPQAGPPAGG
ncbi:MAG TPA: hypothetical protein VF156_14430 [Agromyces sp.]